MESQRFAQVYGHSYRELYRVAVHRVEDGRDRPSPETTALLMHLAQAGPMTLSEMGQHFGRALSTLSVKVTALESDGLLTRQRDGGDGRRALIWLSPAGRAALTEALEVLDTARLAAAAEHLSADQRGHLINGLQALITALSSPNPQPQPESLCHDPTL